jgi:glutamyl-tRNA synthetase
MQAMIWSMDAQENWRSTGFAQASKEIAAKCNLNYKKAVIPLLYAALMGRRQGLPLFDAAELLGQDRVRARLLLSIEFLGGISSKRLDAFKSAWERGEVDLSKV